MLVTVTFAGSRPLYAGSLLSAAFVMIVNSWLPSVRLSSTPVTVIVRGLFQLPGLKVTCAGATVPSVRSLLANEIVTFAVGRLFSTMVNVSLSPNSETRRPDVGVTVNPAVSLSMLVTETSCGSIAAYTGSVVAGGDSTI